jgi:hypothetical protein
MKYFSVLEAISDHYPLPNDLFHYTSAQGLLGMISGSSMWATNIEYLNDTAEFNHGENIITETVNRWKRRPKNKNGVRKKFFELIDEAPRFFQAEDVFVISLTEKRDQLSQWRGYTPFNSGYSIGFDTEQLQLTGWATNKMQLMRCIYSEDQQKKFVDAFIDNLLNRWERRITKTNGQQLTKKLEDEVFEFRIFSIFVAASMKDPAFSEECEWRLLGLHRDYKTLCFRPGASSLVPYIQLQWGEGTKLKDAQPIRSVTCGPCPDPKLSEKSLRRLLDASNLSGVKIHQSDIPFRTW